MFVVVTGGCVCVYSDIMTHAWRFGISRHRLVYNIFLFSIINIYSIRHKWNKKKYYIQMRVQFYCYSILIYIHVYKVCVCVVYWKRTNQFLFFIYTRIASYIISKADVINAFYYSKTNAAFTAQPQHHNNLRWAIQLA